MGVMPAFNKDGFVSLPEYLHSAQGTALASASAFVQVTAHAHDEDWGHDKDGGLAPPSRLAPGSDRKSCPSWAGGFAPTQEGGSRTAPGPKNVDFRLLWVRFEGPTCGGGTFAAL